MSMPPTLTELKDCRRGGGHGVGRGRDGSTAQGSAGQGRLPHAPGQPTYLQALHPDHRVVGCLHQVHACNRWGRRRVSARVSGARHRVQRNRWPPQAGAHLPTPSGGPPLFANMPSKSFASSGCGSRRCRGAWAPASHRTKARAARAAISSTLEDCMAVRTLNSGLTHAVGLTRGTSNAMP